MLILLTIPGLVRPSVIRPIPDAQLLQISALRGSGGVGGGGHLMSYSRSLLLPYFNGGMSIREDDELPPLSIGGSCSPNPFEGPKVGWPDAVLVLDIALLL